MNKKTQILHDALSSIALATPTSAPFTLAQIAATALDAFAACKEYRITARTWWGRNSGPEHKAELRSLDTGEIVLSVEGGSGGWEWGMMRKMLASGLFPSTDTHSPTIYFREVCGVEYEHREVARKRDL